MRRLPLQLLVVCVTWLVVVDAQGTEWRILEYDDPAIDYDPPSSWLDSPTCSDCPKVGIGHPGKDARSGRNGTHILYRFDEHERPDMRRRRERWKGGTKRRRIDSDEQRRWRPFLSTAPLTTSPLSAPNPSTSKQNPEVIPLLVSSSPRFSDHLDKYSRPLPDEIPPEYSYRQSHPSSVDQAVTVTFRFTGIHLSLFCILPNTPPFFTNVTFTLDSKPVTPGLFSFRPEAAGRSFESKSILEADVPHGKHVLRVTLQPDSMLLVDYLNYTTWIEDPTHVHRLFSRSENQTMTEDEKKDKRRKTLTFIAAISSSVGVFTVLSLGICISIWRRRIISARRTHILEEREAEEARRYGLSEGVSRAGVPFIPRFFDSGGHDPPPYDDLVSAPPPAALPPAVGSERVTRELGGGVTLPSIPSPLLDLVPRRPNRESRGSSGLPVPPGLENMSTRSGSPQSRRTNGNYPMSPEEPPPVPLTPPPPLTPLPPDVDTEPTPYQSHAITVDAVMLNRERNTSQDDLDGGVGLPERGRRRREGYEIR